MMKKLKYGCFGIFILATVGFVSCDKTETAMDEWTDVTYVYVKGQALGNNMNKDVVVVEGVGLKDPAPIDYKFRVCLNRAIAEDVTVTLEPTAAGYVDGIKDNTISLSSKNVTIGAGKLVSDTMTLSIDPAFFGMVAVQGEYAPTVFTLQLGAIQSGPDNIRVSKKTAKIVVTLNKKVEPYVNIASGAAVGAVNMDRSGWTGTLGAGVENVIENLYDNNDYTDVASNSCPWEFTIDAGSSIKMLGVKTTHWGNGPYYAPTQIEVQTSIDNSTWKSHGVYSTSGNPQNWHFIAPVTARYMKYILMAPNQRLDVTEFYITVPQP